MMVGKMELPLGYSGELESRVLELPFEKRRLSLFIILPDDIDQGLAALESKISADNIRALLSTVKVK